MLKRFSAVFLTIALIISMVACSSSQQTKKDTTKEAAKEATKETVKEATKDSQVKAPAKNYELSIMWWGAELRHKKFNSILDLYEQKNPNVKIVRQYSPWGDYWTKLATQAAGGNLVDTFGMTAMYKGEYAAKGVMVPLKEYIDKNLIDIKKFTKGAVDAGTYKNELYFITFGDTASALAYNNTLIKAAGVQPPKGGMTIEEYRNYLMALQPKLPKGVYAGDMGAGFEHTFENYVRQQGYDLTSEDGKKIGYPKETLKNYYTFWKGLSDAGVVPPPQLVAEQSGKQWADTMAGQGKIATWCTNANQLKVYQATLKDELGMVRSFIEKDTKRKYAEMVQPSGWTISKNSKNKEETAKLLNFFANDLEAQKIFDMELGNPGSTDIQKMLLDNLKPDANPIDRAKKIEIDLLKEILTTIEPHSGRTAGAPALISDMTKKFDEVMFGKITIDQAVEAHFKAVTTILGS